MKTLLRLALLACGLAVAVASCGAVRGVGQTREVVGTVTIEDGDTLWGLSSDLRGERRRWDWIERTCQLNGWDAVPTLSIGQTVIVPDWRQ